MFTAARSSQSARNNIRTGWSAPRSSGVRDGCGAVPSKTRYWERLGRLHGRQWRPYHLDEPLGGGLCCNLMGIFRRAGLSCGAGRCGSRRTVHGGIAAPQATVVVASSAPTTSNAAVRLPPHRNPLPRSIRRLTRIRRCPSRKRLHKQLTVRATKHRPGSAPDQRQSSARVVRDQRVQQHPGALGEPAQRCSQKACSNMANAEVATRSNRPASVVRSAPPGSAPPAHPATDPAVAPQGTPPSPTNRPGCPDRANCTHGN